MSLEDISAIERLLGRRSRAWTETTDHCSFIMSQCMPVFVVLSGKTLDVVVTSLNRAFLWSLVLVGEHMSFQVLEDLSTLRICASSFFS